MALSWCKVANDLDTHPKIRRAGRLGREVFLFALRRNAAPGNRTPGRISKEELEPAYVADLMMMPADDVTAGVTAAVTAGLLREEQDSWVIVPWKAVWGLGSAGSAERTAKWRSKGRCDDSGDGGDTSDRHSDRSDEDKTRLDKTTKVAAPGDLALAGKLVLEIIKNNPRSRIAKLKTAEKDRLLSGWAEHVRLMRERDGHSEEEISAVIRWCQSDSFWRGNILSTQKLREKWDQLVARMPAQPKRVTVQLSDDEPPLLAIGGRK